MYKDIPFVYINNQKFINFDELNFDPVPENAKLSVSIMTSYAYQLTNIDIKNFFRTIKMTVKLNTNLHITFIDWINLKQSLDIYNFEYDKKFVNNQILSEINRVYYLLKDSKSSLSKEEEDLYIFFLNYLKKNSNFRINELKDKLNYFLDKEKES